MIILSHLSRRANVLSKLHWRYRKNKKNMMIMMISFWRYEFIDILMIWIHRARKSRVYLAWCYEIHSIIALLGTARAQPCFWSHVNSMGDFKAYIDIFHYYNTKERVFLSNNQDGIIENYWMMHILNATNVLKIGLTAPEVLWILTLFWRVLQDLRALFFLSSKANNFQFRSNIWFYNNYQISPGWNDALSLLKYIQYIIYQKKKLHEHYWYNAHLHWFSNDLIPVIKSSAILYTGICSYIKAIFFTIWNIGLFISGI